VDDAIAEGTNQSGGWPRVLVIDGQVSFGNNLASRLDSEAFTLEFARNGSQGLCAFRHQRPDLVLLDPALPDQSGFELLETMYAVAHTPVIIVSTQNSEMETVRALELGAADYVLKPLRVHELVARMRAVLRRWAANSVSHNLVEDEVLIKGPITLDSGSRQVAVGGLPVTMPRMEFDLLHLLMARAGRVVSHEACIDLVWQGREISDTRTLHSHVKRIRDKIEVDRSRPRHLVTVRNVGYRFEP
jgi:two-component system, OmpR family, response regulator RegX3